MTGDPRILTTLVTCIGAIVGSFLNVCIYRLPLGKSVVWPGSACPSCKRQLAWYENIPVLSWLVLRGRCRSCSEPISVRYPFVELLTALLFAAVWTYVPAGPLVAARIVFGCALIVLFAIDLEHHILPNVITIPGIIVGFGFSCVAQPGWQASLLGILFGGGSLWLISEVYFRIRHEEGLGMGDVKMLAMIGAFLGWKLTLVTLMMASFSGSIVGVALIVLKRGDMKYALPFGTFLSIGAALAATVGTPLMDWYVKLW